MRSTKTVNLTSPEITYPRLMEYPPSGAVWLVTQSGTGTVVSPGSAGDSHKLGYQAHGLAMSELVSFHGTITLEND